MCCTIFLVADPVANEIIIGSHLIPIGKNYKDQLLKIVNDRLIGK